MSQAGMHSLVARQRAATTDLAHPDFPFRNVPSYHYVFAWLRDLASRNARVWAVRKVPPQCVLGAWEGGLRPVLVIQNRAAETHGLAILVESPARTGG